MNNTTRNFSTIINHDGNSSANTNILANQSINKYQVAAPVNVKLSPINESKQRSIELPEIVNTDLKKRLENLNNKDAIAKMKIPQEKKFRIKRNKIVEANPKNTSKNEESKGFNYTQFPVFSSRVLAESNENDEVVIKENSIEEIKIMKSNKVDVDPPTNEKLTTIVESPDVDRDEKNTEESKSVHLI